MQTSPRRRRAALFGLALLAPMLAACDPFDSPGTWRATGDNDHNLRMMLAQPGDLAHGQAAEGSRGATSAGAIGRLRDDSVKPLPNNAENFRVGGAGVAAQ
jgi:hypothetical protein